jgi:hypothetical protein
MENPTGIKTSTDTPQHIFKFDLQAAQVKKCGAWQSVNQHIEVATFLVCSVQH